MQDPTETISRAEGGGVPTPTSSHTKEPLPQTPDLRGKLTDAECQTELTDSECQTELSHLQSFSPKLCLELLSSLSPEQIDFEIQWQKLMYGRNFDFKLRNPNTTTKLVGMYKSLCDNILVDNSHIFYDCNAYQELTRDFACLVTRAESCIAELKKKSSSDDDDVDLFYDSVDNLDITPQQPNTQVSSQSLPDPVCTLDISFADFDLHNVKEGLTFKRIGSRQVAYAGNAEYRYGNRSHPNTPYPTNQAIDLIFTKLSEYLNDPDFNKDNYSLLATLYENGQDWIPFHSDDEPGILTDSTIYTVSLGAPREMTFRSIVGKATSLSIPLNHGSVTSMTRKSQDFWEHGILQHETTEARLSLTFRKVQPDYSHQPPPPIRRPRREPLPLETPPSAPTQPPKSDTPSRIIHVNFCIYPIKFCIK